MLGEQLGEQHGKVIGTRVLAPDGDCAKVEISFQASGKFLGLDITEMATYWSVVRSDGSLYGEGHGVLMAKDGSSATWIGSGVGRFTGKGSGTSFRGAIYYHTESRSLARLNQITVLFEHETDENGNTHSKSWEWK
jgi:hypothetical protein